MVPLWRIRYYVSEGGKIPFKDFIGGLSTQQARADCRAWIELLKQLGDTLDGDRHLTHNNRLHEIRDDSVRIFYVCDGNTVIIIDGLLPGQGEELMDAIHRKVEDYASDD